MLIGAGSGATPSVTRTNSIVVADAIRPRTVEPAGRLLSVAVWKIRKDLVVSIEEMVMAWTPLALLTAVPDWTC